MKAKVSEWMDGELDGAEAERLALALREDGEDRQTWRMYHLIGDALRDTRALSAGFDEKMRERLAAEPTVLAPAEPAERAKRRLRGFLMPAAASAAAMALVGWLAFAPERGGPPAGMAPVATAPLAQPTVVSVASEPASVPLPLATEDYLLAHQNYASRSLSRGVAPYVRTVSGRSAEYKR
ncbi:MAG TPA: sigma-E factor negative regulatory protein [Burkholderiales bacterium]|nr:sigma-E factor negative regulatory protein [Burkholderiales bacterium]